MRARVLKRDTNMIPRLVQYGTRCHGTVLNTTILYLLVPRVFTNFIQYCLRGYVRI